MGGVAAGVPARGDGSLGTGSCLSPARGALCAGLCQNGNVAKGEILDEGQGGGGGLGMDLGQRLGRDVAIAP